MAKVFPRTVKDALTAESVTGRAAQQVRDLAGPLLASIVLWADDPKQAGGFGEKELKSAFPDLSPLSDAQTRALLRIVSDIAGGIFIP